MLLPELGLTQEELVDEKPAFFLAGWYDLTTLLIKLMVEKPKKAGIARTVLDKSAANTLDAIDTLDQVSGEQPYMLGLAFITAAYLIGYLLGAPVYFYLRSKKKCGGDRTQDITDSYRFVLQAITITYIICVAIGIIMVLVMSASLYYIGPLVSTRYGLFRDLGQVGVFGKNVTKLLIQDAAKRSDSLVKMQKAVRDEMENSVFKVYLPEVEFHAKNVHISQGLHGQSKLIISAQTSRGAPHNVFSFTHAPELAQLALVHDRVSSMLRAQKDIKAQALKNFTMYIAKQVVRTYANEIKMAASHLPNLTKLTLDYKRDLDTDSNQFSSSVQKFTARLTDDDKSSVTYFIGSHLCIGLTAVANILVVGVACYSMLVGSLAYGYICLPYYSISKRESVDQNRDVLDEVWKYIWPSELQQTYYEALLPGTILSRTGNSRFMDVAPDVLLGKLDRMRNATEVFRDTLRNVKIDGNLILPEDGASEAELSPENYGKIRAVMLDKVNRVFTVWSEAAFKNITVPPPSKDNADSRRSAAAFQADWYKGWVENRAPKRADIFLGSILCISWSSRETSFLEIRIIL
ncbi:hypothetical protein ISCGN_012310 [Ixodes scapularis]